MHYSWLKLLTFSAMAPWIKWASDEMVEMTWNVVEEVAWLSKKLTSCLSTDFKYSIRIRDVCLSAVLVQQNPSAEQKRAYKNHN